MGLVSLPEVYDDPKRWLEVVHEVHGFMRELMDTLFPDFGSKLQGIHCLRCEGKAPFIVYTRDTSERKLVTGYIDQDQGGEPLLFLENPDDILMHGCTPSAKHPGRCAECGEPLEYTEVGPQAR